MGAIACIQWREDAAGNSSLPGDCDESGVLVEKPLVINLHTQLLSAAL